MAPIRDGLRQQGKRGNLPGGSLLKETPSGFPEGFHLVPIGCGWHRFGFKPTEVHPGQTASHRRLPSSNFCQLFDAVDGLGHAGWRIVFEFGVRRLLVSRQLAAGNGFDVPDTRGFVFPHVVSDRILADALRQGRGLRLGQSLSVSPLADTACSGI